MMKLIPEHFCQRLGRYAFKENKDDSYLFELNSFYAKLFEYKNYNIMRKSKAGWQVSISETEMFAHLKNLSNEDTTIIEKFVYDFKQLIVIGINEKIKQFFNNELDWCIALDYNFENRKRTTLGRIEKEAKWNESNIAKDKLIDQLSKNVSNLLLNNSDKMPVLMYIPAKKIDSWPLPKILAEGICANPIAKILLSENKPIIHSSIQGNKEKLKYKPLNEKIAIWNNIIDSDGIELLDSVEGENIIVIDDLYQSGSTLWSFAKFLKSKGARSVHGLVCVKSMSDTDNI